MPKNATRKKASKLAPVTNATRKLKTGKAPLKSTAAAARKAAGKAVAKAKR